MLKLLIFIFKVIQITTAFFVNDNLVRSYVIDVLVDNVDFVEIFKFNNKLSELNNKVLY